VLLLLLLVLLPSMLPSPAHPFIARHLLTRIHLPAAAAFTAAQDSRLKGDDKTFEGFSFVDASAMQHLEGRGSYRSGGGGVGGAAGAGGAGWRGGGGAGAAQPPQAPLPAAVQLELREDGLGGSMMD